LGNKMKVKEIDEKEWLNILKTRQKKCEKNKEIYQVLDMFINMSGELFRTYIGDVITYDNVIKSCDELRNYTIVELGKISKKYGGAVPKISKMIIR